MNSQIIDQVFSECGEDALHKNIALQSNAKSARKKPARFSGWICAWFAAGLVMSSLFLLKAFSLGDTTPNSDKGENRYQTKNIEDIKVGDWVLAEDPETEKQSLKQVVEVYRREVDHLQIVQLSDNQGNRQTIQTTSEHPFWVEGNGWVKAGELKSGNKIRQSEGKPAIVLANQFEQHPKGTEVFNLQVRGFHTYFVAANGSRGPPVLVHNTCNVSNITWTRANHSRLVFDGVEVRAVRRLSHLSEAQLRAMVRTGRSGRLADGRTIVLHHHRQQAAGPMIELPANRNNINNPILHPHGNQPGMGLTRAQRRAWNSWVRDYWKARARVELERRGLTP